MGIISIGFENFKQIVRDRRIYYFEGENFVDLHFLFEGFIVKTTIPKQSIGNPQQFFSDKMFYGAMKLDFNIPVELSIFNHPFLWRQTSFRVLLEYPQL